jgi:hypothetical protein
MLKRKESCRGTHPMVSKVGRTFGYFPTISCAKFNLEVPDVFSRNFKSLHGLGTERNTR